jgi:hypothetical protein
MSGLIAIAQKNFVVDFRCVMMDRCHYQLNDKTYSVVLVTLFIESVCCADEAEALFASTSP